MRRSSAVALVAALLIGFLPLFQAGAADLKELTGTWTGYAYPPRGGNPIFGTVIMKESGTYEYHGGSIRYDGTVTMDGDKFRWESSSGARGTFTVREEKGKRILRSIREDGSLSGEFEHKQ